MLVRLGCQRTPNPGKTPPLSQPGQKFSIDHVLLPAASNVLLTCLWRGRGELDDAFPGARRTYLCKLQHPQGLRQEQSQTELSR